MYDAATAIKLDWPRPTTGVKLVENLAYRRAGTDFYEQEINSALGRMLLGLNSRKFPSSPEDPNSEAHEEIERAKRSAEGMKVGFVTRLKDHGERQNGGLQSNHNSKNRDPLYVHFANLESETIAIENFIENNGFLTSGFPVWSWNNLGEVEQEERRLTFNLIAEPLFYWYSERANLKAFMNLWNRIRSIYELQIDARNRQIRELEDLVDFRFNATVASLRNANHRKTVGKKGDRKTKPKDLATQLLIAEFNDRFEDRVSMRMDFDLDGNPLPVLKPINLLTGMWLQFSNEVAGGVKFSNCQRCAKLMIVGKSRANPRKFCEDNCRQRTFHSNKKKNKLASD